jgi:hypothetical protein
MLYEIDALPTVTIGGMEYAIVSYENILPSDAIEAVDYTLTFMKDGLLHTATVGYSVTDYVEALLSTDYSRYAKVLAVSAVEYIRCAYIYTGKDYRDIYDLLLSDAYNEFLPEGEKIEDTSADLSSIAFAVKSVQLNLSSTMKVRINITESYTGTLSVSGNSFEVVGGLVGDLDYIEITLPAHRLYDEVFTILAENTTVEYSVYDYVSRVTADEGLDESVRDLLLAFYTYTACADRYESIANAK